MPKPRDARHSPQAGDVLSYRGWTIAVADFDTRTSTVLYTRTAPDRAAEGPRTQELSVWRDWSALATVVGGGTEEESCVVFVFGIAGPCTACKKTMGNIVHTVPAKGIFCEGCCPSKKHVRRKAKEKAA